MRGGEWEHQWVKALCNGHSMGDKMLDITCGRMDGGEATTRTSYLVGGVVVNLQTQRVLEALVNH